MNNIKMKGVCKRIVFKNHPFAISVFEDEDGKEFTLKANFTPRVDSPYNIIAVKDEKTNYENTYKCVSISYDIDLNKISKKELVTFLSTLTSENNARNIVDTLDNVVEVLENNDIKTLTTVKGVGAATANRIFENYQEGKDNSADILMLADYGLSDSLVRALLKHYGSGQAVVSVIENNVYDLIKVKGIGFKKADIIFLVNLKGKPDDPRRLEAYVEYFFNKKYQDGFTWISPSDFVQAFQEEMAVCDVKEAIKIINDSDKYEMTVDKDGGKRLSLKFVSDKERSIASNLYRIKHAKSSIVNNNLDKVISEIEDKQGWSYDESQISAIKDIENNNVIMIQGLAGTGKSTIINAYVQASNSNLYTVRQCALSGRAAKNLADITGAKSSTIHSLLGTDFVNGGFLFNKDKKLPVDIVVLDEISMVSLDIFESLVSAIPSGAKLIMLGDNGQLDSIGAGIMNPLSTIPSIKTVTLKNVHRQARKSAIISHSLAYRQGFKPEGLSLKPMTSKVYGENKDLKYIVLPDGESEDERKEIANHALIGVSKILKSLAKNHKVEHIQVITQTISKGMGSANDVNKVAQSIFNPIYDSKNVWKRKYDNYEFEFREGDRVINNNNNRGLINSQGEEVAVFNGSIGTIVSIKPNEYIEVDFDNIGVVTMLSKDILGLSLGYAITVHKSQGSTIPNLVVVMSHHYMLNSQEMLYTSITRAGGDCTVVTTPKAIKRCMATSSSVSKNSNLSIYMENIYKKMEEK